LDCFNEIYNNEFGPFPEDADFGDIPINLPNGNIVELSGSLTCEETVVENGYVKLVQSELIQFIFADSEGNFANAFNLCFADGFDLTGVDFFNTEQSVSTFFVGEEMVEAGAINVCE